MIKTFIHKGLKEVFETGRSSRVRADLVNRARRRLDVIDQAASLVSINLPGFDFHPLRTKPVRYSVHVNGPWSITFEWVDGDAWRVDLEQYH